MKRFIPKIALLAAFSLVMALFGAINPAFAASPSFPGSGSASSDAGASAIAIPAADPESIDPPRLLQGNLSNKLQSDSDIISYFSSNKELFGFNKPKSDLQIVEKKTDPQGKEHVLLQQHYKGIPVYGMYIRTHLDKGKKIYAITNDSSPELNDLALDIVPALNAGQAADALKADIETAIGSAITLGGKLGARELQEPLSALMIYPVQDTYTLAYRVEMEYIDPSFDSWIGFVDANTGAVLKKFKKMVHAAKAENKTATGKGYYNDTRSLNVTQDIDDRYYLYDRTKPMYDASRDEGVIATFDYERYFNGPVSSDTATFNDPDAVDVHYFTGLVYDYYLNELQRNSFDNNGSSLISYVNYDMRDNAFWDGYQMVYGIGDAVFECLSCALDVVAHEITHGVVEYTAGLEYIGQSGALNESLADMMAAVIDSEDWMIGEDTGIVEGSRVLRDMQDPSRGYDPQPSHMDEFEILPEDEDYDNGGVHINSGIPNHAAYLIGTGINQVDGLQGQGKKLLGQIAYGAMSAYLTPTSDFADARDAFILAAGDLELSADLKAEVVSIVRDAWETVGLGDSDGENHIVSFEVPGMVGLPVIDKEEHTVSFAIGYSGSLDGLTPAITVSPGAALTPGSGIAQNFTEPVVYTVTSSSGEEQQWSVNGFVLDPESMNDITSFEVMEQTAPAIINPTDHTVTFYLESDDEITALQPVIEVSNGAVLSGPAAGSVNFMSPQIYTVTAQDGTAQQWTITCIRDSASPKFYGAYATSETTVELVFNKAMNIGSLGNVDNYEVESWDWAYPDAEVTGVYVDALQPNRVMLTTTNLVSNNAYRITVSNLQSESGYSVRPDWNYGFFLTDDHAPPELLTARINGTQLVLGFDEYVSSSMNTKSKFKVTVNGEVVAVEELDMYSRQATLVLSDRVAVEDQVSVSFQPTDSDTEIRDMNGNASLGFEDVPVVNRTAEPIPVTGDGWFQYGQELQQIIKHPEQPVFYAIFKDNLQVISNNMETGKLNTVTLDHQPERLYYSDGELFAVMTHDAAEQDDDGTGSIEILDAESLETKQAFDIAMDPHDIAVDSNGIIYVSDGSDTALASYSRDNGQLIQEANINEASYIQMSPTQSKLYAISTGLPPRDISAYNVNEIGEFLEPLAQGGYDSPYQGEYPMSAPLSMSPDGKYLFNGAGTIFNSSDVKEQDMTYVRTIDAFNDISFDLEHDKFYTVENNMLRVYQYSTFELLRGLTMSRPIAGILSGEKANQLLTVLRGNGGDSTTVTEYYINDSNQTPVPAPAPVPASAPASAPAPATATATATGNLESPDVTLDADSIELDTKKLEQGEELLVVKPDPAKLLEAIKSAQSGAEKSEQDQDQPAVPKVIIKVNQSAANIDFELPASLFAEAAAAAPETILAIGNNNVTYELPIQLLQSDQLKKALGGDADMSKLKVKLSIEKPEESTSKQAEQNIVNDGFSLLTDFFSFRLSVGTGEAFTEIEDFDGTYVTRSIALTTSANADRLTAFVYDPETGESSFVPAVVRKEGGKTIVDIKSPHNSIYTVAQASKTFADIAKHWAKSDIETMASKKIVLGITEQQFLPEKQITRAEFAALLVRALGLAMPQADDRFSDVRTADWHARTVAAAANIGLITGYENGTFAPNGTITRQEMAVMLGRAVRYAQKHEPRAASASRAGNKLDAFSDHADISSWAKKDIELMLDAGIMQGVNANAFQPSASVTRAQAAAALKRTLQHLSFIN